MSKGNHWENIGWRACYWPWSGKPKKKEYWFWRVTSDPSIKCGDGVELVSPTCEPEAKGLCEMRQVLQQFCALQPSADESCSVHVHVDCGKRSWNDGAQVDELTQLKSICTNFCMFEHAFDLAMPAFRQQELQPRDSPEKVYARSVRMTVLQVCVFITKTECVFLTTGCDRLYVLHCCRR